MSTFIVPISRERVIAAYRKALGVIQPMQSRVDAADEPLSMRRERRRENEMRRIAVGGFGFFLSLHGDLYLSMDLAHMIDRAEMRLRAAEASQGDILMGAVEVRDLECAESGRMAESAERLVVEIERLAAEPLDPIWEPPKREPKPIPAREPSVSRTFWKNFWQM